MGVAVLHRPHLRGSLYISGPDPHPPVVESGWNVLVGSDPDLISEAVADLNPPSKIPDVFGDGYAAEKIVEALVDLGGTGGD